MSHNLNPFLPKLCVQLAALCQLCCSNPASLTPGPLAHYWSLPSEGRHSSPQALNLSSEYTFIDTQFRDGQKGSTSIFQGLNIRGGDAAVGTAAANSGQVNSQILGQLLGVGGGNDPAVCALVDGRSWWRR